jgi:hypothetical protein
MGKENTMENDTRGVVCEILSDRKDIKFNG